MKFAKEVFPEGVEIYETYNGGAVKEVQVLQTNGKWYTVYETNTVQRIQHLRKLNIRFQVSLSNILVLKLEFYDKNNLQINYR